MQKLLILITMLFIFSCSSSRSSITDNDIADIQSNFQDQTTCWNKGDLECYVTAYYPSDKVQTITRLGVTYGVEDILKNYQKSFPKGKMGKLHFDEFTYKKLNKQYVYVVGRYNLKFDNREELVQGWFSVLMEKIGGKWYLISDHS